LTNSEQSINSHRYSVR